MIYAVIMAGGRGKRFWPQSRIKMPKQALHIVDKDRSMIQVTVDRITKLVSKDNIRIVTNHQQESLMKSQMSDLEDKNFIIEPDMKNTAACIGLSAVLIRQEDPDATMVVLPADHMIGREDNFLNTVKKAIKVAKDKDALLTFGIKPTFPSTGYGYIRVTEDTSEQDKTNLENGSDKIYKIENFTEKPEKEKAQEFVNEGNYFWNSGMFVWKISTVMKAFKFFMPDLYKYLLEIESNIGSEDFNVKLQDIYQKVEDKSIDYGIMEPSTAKGKADDFPDGYLISSQFGWNDVGSWKSLDDILPKDSNNNVLIGKDINLDTKNSIIISDKDHLIGTIGIEDMIVVHTEDATLVCNKKDAQKVKKLLKLMADQGLQDYL